MAHILRELPEPGTKLGLAFSGGLDTRTAVAWLAERGVEVYAYTADLGQPDEADPAALADVALAHGARAAQVIDCREVLVEQACVALACNAFHLATAGRKYFNTTPLGRVATTTAIVRAMQVDGVGVFGDGSTHKGNDIQRFFRYGLLVEPSLRIYKPWLDSRFVSELGGRREMSAYLESRGFAQATATDKAYSTDANLLGATHEAKLLERLEHGLHLVEPLLGVPFWRDDCAITAESVEVGFEAGRPVSLDGLRFASTVELWQAANRIAGRHGLGTSDQIENRVVEAKSRGIYEAPGFALLHLAYERLLSAIHNENTLDLYAIQGRRLGRLLYEGRWFDAEAAVIKQGLLGGVAAAVTGTVRVELRRGDDYSILDTRAVGASYDAERLSMERVEDAPFLPEDRIGALELQTLSIEDARAKLLARAATHRVQHDGAEHVVLGRPRAQGG